MIESVAIVEEDFLQQFPDNEQYMGEGLPYADWWDTGANPLAVGQPADIAALFGKG
jgi:hypothetical protein